MIYNTLIKKLTMNNINEYNKSDWGLADDHFELFNFLIDKINELETRIEVLEAR